MNKSHANISVVIPASNEEAFIERALDSLYAETSEAEVVVVVNGSTDKTKEKASKYPAKIIETERALGFGGARNLGARLSTRARIIFMDADSFVRKGTLEVISSFPGTQVLGTVLGAPDSSKLIYKFFFALKNAIHVMGFRKGVLGGLFFCDRDPFFKVGGYDESLEVDELRDCIDRLVKSGGNYHILTRGLATTSMRRFEKSGKVRAIIFWFKVTLVNKFGGKRIGAKYASSHEDFD